MMREDVKVPGWIKYKVHIYGGQISPFYKDIADAAAQVSR